MSGGRVVVSDIQITHGFHNSSPAVWISSENATAQMANMVRDAIVSGIKAGQRLDYNASVEVHFVWRISFTYRVTGNPDELTALVALVTHPQPP